MDRFEEDYHRNLEWLRENPPPGFGVESSGMYREDGIHPTGSYVLECVFAAEMLHKVRARRILDVGSYRLFTIGLCAAWETEVTVLEIREVPDELCGSEVRVVGDIKEISLPVRYDAVVSLCALEHFGLGKYGEEFDINADRKAIGNIADSLVAGGHFIFTTTIGEKAIVWFNAHRVYSHEILHDMAEANGFDIVKERVILIGNDTSFQELADGPIGDINWYCGCWRKR